MPSPFPGMNPYLEHRDLWQEIHHWLIMIIAESLINQLVPKYIVELKQQFYLTTLKEKLSNASPDAIAASQPAKVTIPMPIEVKNNYLEIKEMASKRVVTAIEVLSLVSKDAGREKYQRKRQRILGSLTNLVEIDLLRDGKPMPLIGEEVKSDYRILVSRSDTRPTADMYAFNVQNQIPLFPVPLQPGDAEPVVNLKDLLDLVYDRARFDLKVDYSTEPMPCLSEGDAAWADGLLKELELR